MHRKSPQGSTASDTTSQEANQRGAPEVQATNPLVKRIGYLITLGTGTVALVVSLDLRIGTVALPGPGFWPLTASVLIIAISCLGLITYCEPVEMFHSRGVVRVASILFMITAIPMAYPYAGFVLPAILFMIFKIRFLSGAPWITTISVSVTVPLVIVFVFTQLLNVRLQPFL